MDTPEFTALCRPCLLPFAVTVESLIKDTFPSPDPTINSSGLISKMQSAPEKNFENISILFQPLPEFLKLDWYQSLEYTFSIKLPPENFPAFITLFFGARFIAQATTAEGGFALVALLWTIFPGPDLPPVGKPFFSLTFSSFSSIFSDDKRS